MDNARPLRKLLIGDLAARERYVTRECAHLVRTLVRDHGWTHLEPAQLWTDAPRARRRMEEACGGPPDAVLFIEQYNLIRHRMNVFLPLESRRFVYAIDLHGSHEVRFGMQAAFAVCDVVFAKYAPVLANFHPWAAAHRRVVWMPACASPDFHVPLDPDAARRVLVSGAIDEQYPLREQLRDLADQGHPGIEVTPHPGYHCGYDYGTDARVGPGYAQHLRRHRVAFTDASRYGYMLSKHFEIPATGSLLLADDSVADQLTALGFDEGVHYVGVSRDTLEARLAYVLDPTHDEAIDAIRAQGQALVQEHHVTAVRARRLDDVCEEVVRKRPPRPRRARAPEAPTATPEIRLSVAIQHVPEDPQRAAWVAAACDQLRRESPETTVTVIADVHREGCWATYRRALLAADDATHHLVLQDDAELCRAFVPALLRALTARPEALVSPFTSAHATYTARHRNESWLELSQTGGLALVWPRAFIDAFLAWEADHVNPAMTWDDVRVSMWLAKTGRSVYATVPSLVEHLGWNASTLGLNHPAKVAAWFVGHDGKALQVDWLQGRSHPVQVRTPIAGEHWQHFRAARPIGSRPHAGG